MGIRFILLTSLFIMSTSITADVASSEKAAKAAIEFRQAIFKLIKSNVGPLGGMARGKVDFDAEVVTKNAERVYQLSQMIPDYFATNTSQYDLRTDALAKIWSNMDDFSNKTSALQTASRELLETAATGDESNTKKAIGAMFKTCKSCHDDYKKDH